MDPVTAVTIVIGLVVSAVLGTGLVRSRAQLSHAERDRELEVAAGIDSELTRRQHELEARVDLLRTNAQGEADRTMALAAQALAAADQSREQSAQDSRRSEDRRAQVEIEVASMRTEVERMRAEVERMRDEARRREDRIAERESLLATEAAALGARATEVETRVADLAARGAALTVREASFDADHAHALERIAALTAEQAKAELVASIEATAKREAALTVREIEREAKDEGEHRARRIVTLAAQRIASEQTAESTVTVLHLPDDSMKGRIIGREGRNIRTFEAVTGVNLLIDDTPEAVLLSSFDPIRREVARLTLEALVADGRIQPSRIEEEYERSRLRVDEQCVRAGEDALMEVGLGDMHPDLIALLGRLRYRTSYGQNVLGHLKECAHLAGIMAAELRLPIEHAKRCALLHDIGKALTHEVQGSHALIGAEVARRFGEDEDVVHAIEAHHNEVEVRTLEAVLTQTADSMSGGRPGARRESLEHYVERLEKLEAIASSHDGVEKVFAMQAGREIRVVVVPDVVDDLAAQVMARDIAAEIEKELTYPGQIRVTVVRESRATGLAR